MVPYFGLILGTIELAKRRYVIKFLIVAYILKSLYDGCCFSFCFHLDSALGFHTPQLQCQALREGAPEIRRTKFSRSSMPSYEDDEIRDQRSFASTSADAKDSDTTSPGSVTIIRSSSKSVKWDGSDDEDDGDLTPGTVNGKTYHHHSDAQSVRIVPWSRLLPDRPIVEAMDLDKLSMEDRDMYLRDFFPPDPFIRMSWNIESPNSSPGRGDSLADSPMAQSNDDILLEEDFDLTVAAQPER